VRHPEADIRGRLAQDPSLAREQTRDRIALSFERIAKLLARCDGVGAEAALDVGSGPGFDTFALAAHFDRVVAVDPSREAIEEGNRIASAFGVRNVEFRRADAVAGLGDGEFDFALSNIMSHVSSSRVGLTRALRRALRDGGWLSYVEACEGYAPMEIDGALERHDPGELRVRLRQIVNGFTGKPSFRFFVSGTFAQVAAAHGFETGDPARGSWEGLTMVEDLLCRVARPADDVATGDADYVELPRSLEALRTVFENAIAGGSAGVTSDGAEPLAAFIAYIPAIAAVFGSRYRPEPSIAERIRARLRPSAGVDWAAIEQAHSDFRSRLGADGLA
jgi:SAM-dependent methyltransferase